MDAGGRAMQEQLPRMRAGFAVVCPHPGPRQPLPALLYLLHPCSRLPEGEGEKRYALFSGRVSIRNFPHSNVRYQTAHASFPLYRKNHLKALHRWAAQVQECA